MEPVLVKALHSQDIKKKLFPKPDQRTQRTSENKMKVPFTTTVYGKHLHINADDVNVRMLNTQLENAAEGGRPFMF